MGEFSVRITQLVSSNVNALVDAASEPAKMARLLVAELEEAIIALTRDAAQAERSAKALNTAAEAQAKAAAEWQDKARFAMTKEREDLARGALAERANAEAAAAEARSQAADAATAAQRARAAVAQLEMRLDEARARFKALKDAAGSGPAASSHDKRLDRIETLEKRLDLAGAEAGTQSLDAELAALAREDQLDAELAALRKKVAKKK